MKAKLITRLIQCHLSLITICLSLLIVFYSCSVFAGLNLCSDAKAQIMPSIGYTLFNDKSLIGGNLSYKDGSLLCGFYGAYVEYFAGMKDQHRVGAGTFIGALLFGLDFAVLYHYEDQKSAMMYRLRPLITFEYFDIYYGVVMSPSTSNMDFFSEFGFLLKFPIWSKNRSTY
jgi:hypothetical protein